MRGGTGARGSGRGGTGAKDTAAAAAPAVESDILETKLILPGGATGVLDFVGLNGDLQEGYELEGEGPTLASGALALEFFFNNAGNTATWARTIQLNGGAPSGSATPPGTLLGTTWFKFEIHARRATPDPSIFLKGGQFWFSTTDTGPNLNTSRGSFYWGGSHAAITSLILGQGGTWCQPGFRATLRRKRFSV
jgi:hypothetical protein